MFHAASTSQSVLTAFFYGRAFAQTLNRRLGEFVVDVVAEVGGMGCHAAW